MLLLLLLAGKKNTIKEVVNMDNTYMFQYTNMQNTMCPVQVKPINANQLVASFCGRGTSNYPTFGTIPAPYYPVPNRVGLPSNNNMGY